MIKYLLLLHAISIATVVLSAPQHQKLTEKGLANKKLLNVDDVDDGASKEDLKGASSYGYGYYAYPYGGFYGGYPFDYGLHGRFYGGYYPYYGSYGGYGYHGHFY